MDTVKEDMCRILLKHATKKNKTPAVIFLKLFSHDSFLLHHLLKNFSDEKYSGTPPPTSPNSFTIQDAGDSSMLRCTLWIF